LFYKLMKRNENIFIPTTSSFEMRVLSKLLVICKGYSGKIFLHFHQFKRRGKKLKLLDALVKKHPDWYILASTERLAKIFGDAGFKHVQAVAYPVFGRDDLKCGADKLGSPRLLYIGAAREDKGFIQIVDFIEYAVREKYDFEYLIQCSTPHGGKHNEKVASAISKLKSIQSDKLCLLESTLTEREYWSSFDHAICFVVYDKNKYADSVSGVLLDAMFSHVPVITTQDTWMSDIIIEYGSGKVVSKDSPVDLLVAVNKILSEYDHYAHRAKLASNKLNEFHNPRFTINYIEKNL